MNTPFTEHSLHKHLSDFESQQALNAKQTAYVEKIEALEQELLSRTVIVTCVRDLRQESNVSLLRTFLETTYGTVESCIAIPSKARKKQWRTGYPWARVRFQRKACAERIFGNRPLNESQKIEVRPPVKFASVAVRLRSEKEAPRQSGSRGRLSPLAPVSAAWIVRNAA